MLTASLVLAASLMGQSVDNSGTLIAGNVRSFVTFDKSKPLHFNGGSLSMDLTWQPAMDSSGGGFVSPPFNVPGISRQVTLQFYSRVGNQDGSGPNTWGLVEVSLGGGSVGDYTVAFDAGSNATNVKWTAVPASASAPLAGTVLWALQRSGVTSFTLTQ